MRGWEDRGPAVIARADATGSGRFARAAPRRVGRESGGAAIIQRKARCYHCQSMEQVNVGIIGLGNVGSGTLAILAENGEQIDLKLGFRLRVKAVCSRHAEQKTDPGSSGPGFEDQ